MTTTHISPTVGRRNIFASGAALAVVGMAAVPPPGPDADLIAMSGEAATLATQFERNGAAFFALPAGHPDLERVADLNDAPAARLDEMFNRAAEMEATTLAGAIAKARLLQHQMRMQHTVGGQLCITGRMDEFAWGLVSDLLWMEGRA